MSAPTTPGAVLRALADLIDSGTAEVSAVTLTSDQMPRYDMERGMVTEPRITASIVVTYPPDAAGVPAIEAGP